MLEISCVSKALKLLFRQVFFSGKKKEKKKVSVSYKSDCQVCFCYPFLFCIDSVTPVGDLFSIPIASYCVGVKHVKQ